MGKRDIRPALNLRKGKHVKGYRFSYKIDVPIGQGGSGVVYKAACIQTSDAVAIKFFLPIYDMPLSAPAASGGWDKSLPELKRLHEKEIQCLKEMRHPNVVRIMDRGAYEPKPPELIPEMRAIKELNFFVMEFIEGLSLAKWLRRTKRRKSEVLSTISSICDALIYLHEVKEYLHADIRAANIIVRQGTNEAVLIDFALYKNFNFTEAGAQETTKLLGDWDLFPKDLPTAHPLKRCKERGGTREELKSLCFPGLDLFQFGKLIHAHEADLASAFSARELEYLRLLESELTSWQCVHARTSRWLKEQFSKLQPTYSQFMGVEELTPPSSAKVTLQLPGRVITLSPLVDRLCNTRSFRRLRSINQLSFLDILYPGAGYRRHLHCLRAYAYCADLIESLTHSARFRLLFSPSLARQALVMALLHDINHFPLLHVFQEARGDFTGAIDLLDLFCDGTATQDPESIYDLVHEVGLTREQFRALILLPHEELAEKGSPPGLQIVKSMIDSGADVDKMAYLEDDSSFTGVAYGGGVDYARLIPSATVVRVPSTGARGDRWHLAFREDGLSAVESLVMARYWMFRTVYWHRVNRAIIAMLLQVIRKLYAEGAASPAEFIIDTMWRPEEQVLEYLNDKYNARFGTDSITRLILRDRSTIYDRFLTIQGASRDAREGALYDALVALDPLELQACRLRLANALADYMRSTFSAGVTLGEEHILFDIPGRRLDTAGPIYIELANGEVRPIEDVHGPIQRLVGDFERLAKRARVFVHPRILRIVGTPALAARRADLMKLVRESLPPSAGSQIR